VRLASVQRSLPLLLRLFFLVISFEKSPSPLQGAVPIFFLPHTDSFFRSYLPPAQFLSFDLCNASGFFSFFLALIPPFKYPSLCCRCIPPAPRPFLSDVARPLFSPRFFFPPTVLPFSQSLNFLFGAFPRRTYFPEFSLSGAGNFPGLSAWAGRSVLPPVGVWQFFFAGDIDLAGPENFFPLAFCGRRRGSLFLDWPFPERSFLVFPPSGRWLLWFVDPVFFPALHCSSENLATQNLLAPLHHPFSWFLTFFPQHVFDVITLRGLLFDSPHSQI